MRFLSLLLLAAVLSAPGLVSAAPAAEAELKADLARLQGKWKGKVTGDDSGHSWMLEVKGNQGTLTVSNGDGDVVVKATCDFKLEQHGRFRAFTYSNLKYITGDKAGETELTGGKTQSSLYRFQGDSQLSTIGGFRDDAGDDPQWLIPWEKVQ